MKLIVATNNKGKLLEIEQILEDSGIELLHFPNSIYLLNLRKLARRLKKTP